MEYFTTTKISEQKYSKYVICKVLFFYCNILK